MECRASAVWDGSPIKGKGAVTTQNGALRETHYVAQATKVGGGRTTNSAELIAAAHAASFSIALCDALNRAGFKAERIVTTATVTSEDSLHGRLDHHRHSARRSGKSTCGEALRLH